MEKQVIQSVGFRNTVKDGEITGFQFKIRLPYYRGIFLSQIRPGTLFVDDMRIEKEQITWCIGGEEYTLLLTTRATKEIAGRYGGLENLGDKLLKSENFEMAIGEVVWLITLLANQPILVHNIKHKDEPKELLTEELVELLTAPADLALYKAAITEALYRGTKRNIESENDPKNAAVG